MAHPISKRPFDFSKGKRIVGKWHQKHYEIVSRIGEGAVGTVYLVRTADRFAALKVCKSGVSISSEVNALKILSKVQGFSLGPSLIDVDDYVEREIIPFYVMEFIKGIPFRTFIEKEGGEWVAVLIAQLLDDLHKLHRHGYVFGDLKPENLIVQGPPYRMRCIDPGGMTKLGRSVKEFTEFYDRGHWRMGNRAAEPSYDLFSVAMIIVSPMFPTSIKSMHDLNHLEKVLENKQDWNQVECVVKRAWRGHYKDALEMKNELIRISVYPETPTHLSRFAYQSDRRNFKKTIQKVIVIMILVVGAGFLFYKTEWIQMIYQFLVW
jgi:serine/threonine protein kinase